MLQSVWSILNYTVENAKCLPTSLQVDDSNRLVEESEVIIKFITAFK